ncbi:MAG: winged helix-turn-helix domain-containing protein [Chloroflexales bacterium]|nr:winged helix-turn-helix domain-containing protein [Chloroflexales bacterium]
MTHTLSSFPVVRSVLDPAALLHHVATYYDIGSPRHCVLLRSWINEVYGMQTSCGRFILKVFRHGWRTPDEVAYEIERCIRWSAAPLHGEPLDLTQREFALLALLIRRPGRAFSRSYLTETLWEYEALEGDHAIDNAILRLRRKLGEAAHMIETGGTSVNHRMIDRKLGEAAHMIETLRRHGYRWRRQRP